MKPKTPTLKHQIRVMNKNTVISEYMSELGKRQWADMPKEERSEKMRKLVNKRWKKEKKKKLGLAFGDNITKN